MRNQFVQTIIAGIVSGVVVYAITRRMMAPPQQQQPRGIAV